MPNNLQALQTLKQSATEQKNELESTIKEIHTQSLSKLNKTLESSFNTKLSNLENSIQSTIAKNIQNSIKTKNWIIITLTALVSLSVAIPTTWYLKPAEKVQAQENIIHAQPQTLYKEVENPKVIQENRSLHAQNEALEREAKANESKIKQLQAENKSLKEWSIPENMRQTDKEGKYIRTKHVYPEEGSDYKWAKIKE